MTPEGLKHNALPYISHLQLAKYLDSLLDQVAAVHAEIRRRVMEEQK